MPLTLRALNRATLARQMLLARVTTTPLCVVERLIGLQAQLPRPPFIGLWSRAAGFRRDDLSGLLQRRKVVRATAMRGTLHLMTAKDFVSLRAALQPALTQGTLAILRGRAKGVAIDRLVSIAGAFFAERPRTFEELRDFLVKRFPKGDIRALAYIVRTHLPLVQVPVEATWGYAATSSFALAEPWLGKRLKDDESPGPLVLRYLAAFGPAGASDVQTWSGLPPASVREALAELRPKLATFRERARELFDLPKAPRPEEDADAPVRFLPEFDNLVLSHANRKRFIADAHRRFVFLPGLRVAATFLVDGFVAGVWRIEREKDTATLVLEPFAVIPKHARDPLAAEGDALVHFVEGDARSFTLRFAKPRS